MQEIYLFDRVVLIRKYGKLSKVGEVYEVANISDDGVVILREVKTKVAICSISLANIGKYFKMEDDKKTWSEWTTINGYDGKYLGAYRTNNKKVEVKIKGIYRGVASCNTNYDDFNVYLGLRIAFLRAYNKYLAEQKNYYTEKLNSVNSLIGANKIDICNIINHLKEKESNNKKE